MFKELFFSNLPTGVSPELFRNAFEQVWNQFEGELTRGMPGAPVQSTSGQVCPWRSCSLIVTLPQPNVRNCCLCVFFIDSLRLGSCLWWSARFYFPCRMKCLMTSRTCWVKLCQTQCTITWQVCYIMYYFVYFFPVVTVIFLKFCWRRQKESVLCFVGLRIRSFIFTPAFHLGRVAGAVALRRL